MRYAKEGKKTDFLDGILTEVGRQYSLVYLLSNCADFLAEKTDLEHLVDKISGDKPCRFSIIFTPKFHCEIAGEGIEYSWGASKKWYRRRSYADKRSFANFLKLVKESMERVTMKMARRFSAKARRYMMVYHHQMKEIVLLEASGVILNDGEKLSFCQNELLHKKYKSHRDASTMDGAFIERVMRECIGVEELEEVVL